METFSPVRPKVRYCISPLLSANSDWETPEETRAVVRLSLTNSRRSMLSFYPAPISFSALRGADVLGGGRFTRLGLLPGVVDAMDYGNVGENCQHPQHGRHMVEHGPDDHQHQPLRTFQEAYPAGADERFRPRPRVAHHHGAGHHYRHQYHVKKAVGARIEEQQAEEDDDVAVA